MRAGAEPRSARQHQLQHQRYHRRPARDGRSRSARHPADRRRRHPRAQPTTPLLGGKQLGEQSVMASRALLRGITSRSRFGHTQRGSSTQRIPSSILASVVGRHFGLYFLMQHRGGSRDAPRHRITAGSRGLPRRGNRCWGQFLRFFDASSSSYRLWGLDAGSERDKAPQPGGRCWKSQHAAAAVNRSSAPPRRRRRARGSARTRLR
jgi:hypothetical protein